MVSIRKRPIWQEKEKEEKRWKEKMIQLPIIINGI